MSSPEYSLIHMTGLGLFAITALIHILSLSFPESYAVATASTTFSNGTAIFLGQKVSAIEWGSHISCYAFDVSGDTSKDLCQKTRNTFKFNVTDLHGDSASADISTKAAETSARNTFDYASLGFTGLSVIFAGTHHTFKKHGWYSSAGSTVSNIITIALQEVLVQAIGTSAGGVKIGTTTNRRAGYWLLIIRTVLLIVSATLVHFGHGENQKLAESGMKDIKQDEKKIEGLFKRGDNIDDQDKQDDNAADNSDLNDVF